MEALAKHKEEQQKISDYRLDELVNEFFSRSGLPKHEFCVTILKDILKHV